MIRRFLKPKTWLALLVVAVVTLLLWPPIQRVIAVAALQNSFQLGWEISFDSPTAPSSPPSFIESKVDDLLDRMFEDTEGYSRAVPALARNRNVIYQERYRAFFRVPIREVHIHFMEGLRGDLGAALARFPGLRRVTVEDVFAKVPTEAEWRLLCTHLRSLPDLEEVELGGTWITDASIAPLSGHPRLEKVTIGYGPITLKCAETFARMPRLTKLEFGWIIIDGDESKTRESQKAMSASMPGVSIKFPGVSKDPNN